MCICVRLCVAVTCTHCHDEASPKHTLLQDLCSCVLVGTSVLQAPHGHVATQTCMEDEVSETHTALTHTCDLPW